MNRFKRETERITGMTDVKYDRDEWVAAVESANLYEWEPVDSGERNGPLARWLCEQAIDSADRDPLRIEAAIEALSTHGEWEFTPDRLLTALASFCESGDSLTPVSVHGMTYRFDRNAW